VSRYSYSPYSKRQLRRVAQKIRTKFRHCRIDRPGVGDLAIDIERIIELSGFEILPRPWPMSVEAYSAAHPRLILVNELGSGYVPRYRNTLAEEFGHKVLEFKLWSGGTLPDNHRAYDLTPEQYSRIEQDAKTLAAEILEYEPDFSERYKYHLSTANDEGLTGDRAIKSAIHRVADDFYVSETSASKRAVKLSLIDSLARRRCYPIIY
jgi:Zn-dependent peptidase ImmA (M78 family)